MDFQVGIASPFDLFKFACLDKSLIIIGREELLFNQNK
jgi:hypothetical protein